jgi:hypothetical protein
MEPLAMKDHRLDPFTRTIVGNFPIVPGRTSSFQSFVELCQLNQQSFQFGQVIFLGKFVFAISQIFDGKFQVITLGPVLWRSFGLRRVGEEVPLMSFSPVQWTSVGRLCNGRQTTELVGSNTLTVNVIVLQRMLGH